MKINTEAMLIILKDEGIDVTELVAESISEAFSTHLDLLRESENTIFIHQPKERCRACDMKDEQIKHLENIQDIYREGVLRRHPGAVFVEVDERSREVFYDYR